MIRHKYLQSITDARHSRLFQKFPELYLNLEVKRIASQALKFSFRRQLRLRMAYWFHVLLLFPRFFLTRLPLLHTRRGGFFRPEIVDKLDE